MNRAPGVVWEAGIKDELEAGAQVSFIALGSDDVSKDTIEGWFIILEHLDGRKMLLVKQAKSQPRLFKTYAGIVAFARQHFNGLSSITLPITPTVRSSMEAWGLIEKSYIASIKK